MSTTNTVLAMIAGAVIGMALFVPIVLAVIVDALREIRDELRKR